MLDETYQLFERGRRLKEALDEMKREIEIVEVQAPDDIENQIAEIMRKRPTLRWDEAVRKVLTGETDEEDEASPPGKKRVPEEKYLKLIKKVFGDDEVEDDDDGGGEGGAVKEPDWGDPMVQEMVSPLGTLINDFLVGDRKRPNPETKTEDSE